MRARGRVVVAAMIVAAVVVGGRITACSAGGSTHATIDVDAPVSLADRPLHIAVGDLIPYDTVTVRSQAVDHAGKQWYAEATFTANRDGVVDLDRARATSGTYTGVDGMGLFWSMNPRDGNPDQQFYLPQMVDGRPTSEIRISVTAHGRTLATRTLSREWMADGVTTRGLTVATDKVAGRLFLPAAGGAHHPAVLIFGGSEGGMSEVLTAALLASHGYATLTIAYFREPGLPAALRNIPLEYFASAARLLARQRGVDPAHLIVMGYSRGSEAALLLAQDYPALFHGAVLCAPSAVVRDDYPETYGNAWTLAGVPLPKVLISVNHISGPVLAIAGADDALSESFTAGPLIMHELDSVHDPYPHQALVYPHAGHNVGTYPYGAQGTQVMNPVTGRIVLLGGTRPGTAVAEDQGWPNVLALLASL